MRGDGRLMRRVEVEVRHGWGERERESRLLRTVLRMGDGVKEAPEGFLLDRQERGRSWTSGGRKSADNEEVKKEASSKERRTENGARGDDGND